MLHGVYENTEIKSRTQIIFQPESLHAGAQLEIAEIPHPCLHVV